MAFIMWIFSQSVSKAMLFTQLYRHCRTTVMVISLSGSLVFSCVGIAFAAVVFYIVWLYKYPLIIPSPL